MAQIVNLNGEDADELKKMVSALFAQGIKQTEAITQLNAKVEALTQHVLSISSAALTPGINSGASLLRLGKAPATAAPRSTAAAIAGPTPVIKQTRAAATKSAKMTAANMDTATKETVTKTVAATVITTPAASHLAGTAIPLVTYASIASPTVSLTTVAAATTAATTAATSAVAIVSTPAAIPDVQIRSQERDDGFVTVRHRRPRTNQHLSLNYESATSIPTLPELAKPTDRPYRRRGPVAYDRPVLQGTAQDHDGLKGASIIRRRFLHIWAVKKNTTEEDMMKYLEKKSAGISFTVKRVIKPNRTYESFIIGIPENHFDKFLSPSMWPEYSYFNEWLFRNQGTQPNEA